MQAHISTRMGALLGALSYLLITDCWVMLLPCKMEDFCCKVLLERGVSLSTLGSWQMPPVLERWFFTPSEIFTIFQLEIFPDWTRPLFFRGTQNDLEAQWQCVCCHMCEVNVRPGINTSRSCWAEGGGHDSVPVLLLGRFCPSHPVPCCWFIKLSFFCESSERFDKICQGNYYFEGFSFFLFNFNGAGVVQKVDFHTYPAQATPD